MNASDNILNGHFIGGGTDKDWPALNRADCRVLQLKVILKDFSKVAITTDYGLMLSNLLKPELVEGNLCGSINPLSWSPDRGMGRCVLVWIWKKGPDLQLHSIGENQVEHVLNCLKSAAEIESFDAREKMTTEHCGKHTLLAEHHYTQFEPG